MKQIFLPYELALNLKKKGFNEPCLAKWNILLKGEVIPDFFYNYESEGLWFNHNNKDVSGLNGNNGRDFLWSAPTHQQANDWLRDKHKLFISVLPTTFGKYCFDVYKNRNNYVYQSIEVFDNYYEAVNKSIQEALKFIQNESK